MNKTNVINSRQNTLVKQARAVRDGKIKELVFVEGVRLCEEAASAGLSIEAVLFTESISHDSRGAALRASLESTGGQLYVVSESVLESISDTKTPQGIVALARRPLTNQEALTAKKLGTPLIVILHRINNPANAGAMLRAAEAAGATAAIATQGTTDIFSPKALRGAMGSIFRLPAWTGASFGEVTGWCAKHGIRTVSTDVRSARLHTEVDWTTPRAVVVGSEGNGLNAEEVERTDESIKIPMREPVESLNAAVALAVVLYEAARQRAKMKAEG